MSDLSTNPDLFGTTATKATEYAQGKLIGRKKYYVQYPDSGTPGFGNTIKFKFQQQNRAGSFNHLLQDLFLTFTVSAPTVTGTSTYCRWCNALALNIFSSISIWSNGSLIVQNLNPNALLEYLMIYTKYVDWGYSAAYLGYKLSNVVRSGDMRLSVPLDIIAGYVDNFLCDLIQDNSFEIWYTFNPLSKVIETDGTGTLGGSITSCYLDNVLLEGNKPAIGTQLTIFEEGFQNVVNPNVPTEFKSAKPGIALPDLNFLDNGAPGILIPSGTTSYAFDFSPFTQYALCGIIAYFQKVSDVNANIYNQNYQPWDQYQLTSNNENLDNWMGNQYHSYSEYWNTIDKIDNLDNVRANLIGDNPQSAASALTNVLYIPYSAGDAILVGVDNPFSRTTGYMSFYPFNKPYLNFKWNTATTSDMYLRVIPVAYRVLSITGEAGNARLGILYQ